MKKLVVEASCLLVLLSLTYLVLTTYVDRHFIRINQYMASSRVKEQRLASIEGPKLVLVGGSNLLFGFDSKLFQQGQRAQIVNMGLHAGLGLSFMLNESIHQISQRDTVILCPEYNVNEGSINAQVELLVENPDAQPYFDYTPYDQLRVYTAKFQRVVTVPASFLGSKPKVPRTYRVANLNEFGDIVELFPEDNKPINIGEVFPRQSGDLYTRKLNKFIDEATARGAVVYFTFSPICASSFRINQRLILTLEKLCKSNLHCRILGSVTDFVYPDDQFFDSIYHLRSEARTMRTKQLISLLNRP